jgi:hypothetical protein
MIGKSPALPRDSPRFDRYGNRSNVLVLTTRRGVKDEGVPKFESYTVGL